MKLLRYVLIAAVLFTAFCYLNNTSLFSTPEEGKPVLLAHRGLHQTFTHHDLKSDTCTATRIYPPEHEFIENTLPSIDAAFRAGADIVELDVHPTTDGHFAVFHDRTLGCRTEGKGVTRDHTLAELKALDIGYGYTADGGMTFPLRGKGVGLMPTLDEVLARFPDKRFLINVKGDDPEEGKLLAARIEGLSPDERNLLMVYGGKQPIAELNARLPDIKVMSRDTLKRCGLTYLAVGWTGYVPQACRNTLLLVPANYAGLLWGWPERFLQRMRAAGSDVFVTGNFSAGDPGTSGIDDATSLAAIPKGFAGGIWTNRIDRIGPAVREAARLKLDD